MKNLKSLLPVLLLAMGLFVVACGGDASQNNSPEKQETSTETGGHDHSSHDHSSHDHSGHSHDGHNHGTATHPHDAAYSSAYVCPMHCPKSGSDTAGTCPACGMVLGLGMRCSKHMPCCRIHWGDR